MARLRSRRLTQHRLAIRNGNPELALASVSEERPLEKRNEAPVLPAKERSEKLDS